MNIYKKVYECPDNNLTNSCCSKIAKNTNDKKYFVGFGWGNINSKILFIGINPRDGYYLECNKERYFEESKNADYSKDKHFNYHRRILNKYYNFENYNESLKNHAFFTEIILCPGDLNKEIQINSKEQFLIAQNCHNLHIKKLIQADNFEFVITIGRLPSLIISSELKQHPLENKWDATLKKIGKKKVLIRSWHPNSYKKKESLSKEARVNKIVNLMKKYTI
jgi:hypothetical protein